MKKNNRQIMLEMFSTTSLNESQNMLLEKILDKMTSVNSPNDVVKFMDKNHDNIEKTKQKLSGKQKTWFTTACDYIKYAVDKGMSFIGKHWFAIIKLIGIILVGMFASKLYPLISKQIDMLFNPDYGIDKAIKSSKGKLAKYSKDSFEVVDKAEDAIETIAPGSPAIQDKVRKELGKQIPVVGVKGIGDIATDELKMRRMASTPGNASLLR